MTHKPRAFAWGVGVILLATIAVGIYRIEFRQKAKVIVGTKDEVYYYGDATEEEAVALGQALISCGFLTDRGMTVLLAKGHAGVEVSFVVKQDAWNHPDTLANYEVIGRRIAPWLGGFPMRVRLIDEAGKGRKDLTIGRVLAGTRDEVYYFGSATWEDAHALGQKLQAIGFFAGLGASAAVSKDNGTAIWFVTNEGFWDKPQAVAEFERVAREAAPSVGGLPVEVRLLNADMETKKRLTVQ